MTAKVKRPARWQRLARLLRREWMTSMDQVRAIGTVTPSKVRSEMREHGIRIRSRIRRGTQSLEYRA